MSQTRRRVSSRAALVFLCLILPPPCSGAQASQRIDGESEFFAGSELEHLLRYLQDDGRVALYPWSIRGFSPGEIEGRLTPSDTVYPWSAHYAFEASRM